jgi:dCMP deaminase
MSRLNKNEYYLGIAKAVAMRSTCLRKAYGAIIVKNDRVMATGYNGVPVGEAHCTECTKRGHGKDIETYLSCKSCHAEQNALLVPSRQEMLGADLYLAGFDVKSGEHVECEAWPCEICLRLIKNAGINRVINRTGIIYERMDDGIMYCLKEPNND